MIILWERSTLFSERFSDRNDALSLWEILRLLFNKGIREHEVGRLVGRKLASYCHPFARFLFSIPQIEALRQYTWQLPYIVKGPQQLYRHLGFGGRKNRRKKGNREGLR